MSATQMVFSDRSSGSSTRSLQLFHWDQAREISKRRLRPRSRPCSASSRPSTRNSPTRTTGLRRSVAQDPVVLRWTTWPGIGPITASAYVAALDDAARFGRASQVASYLGLVPREYSSGEQQRRGRVLRSAHPYLQSLLVQAAWRVWRSTDTRTASLRAWAQGIAHRRGKKIAMVDLALRLARILFAMWHDGVPYDAAHTRPTRTTGTAAIEDVTAPA